MHNTEPRFEGSLPPFMTAVFPADMLNEATLVERPQKCQTFDRRTTDSNEFRFPPDSRSLATPATAIPPLGRPYQL